MPEFQVNVTTAGNQQDSSVAMADNGVFVITWESAQEGVADNIVARVFNADGSPAPGPGGSGPLDSEIPVNTTTTGDHQYPDVSINLAGTQYVVAWQSAGQDGSGWGVYSRLFSLAPQPVQTYTNSNSQVSLNVGDNILLGTMTVQLNLTAPNPHDLTITLTGPNGTTITLCTGVPKATGAGIIPAGSNFSGTIFDDSATTSIDSAFPPFSGSFIPEQALSTFAGLSAKGTWTLNITGGVFQNLSWSMVITPALSSSEIRVNTTTAGDQMYPSVAMAYDGNYTITWSGNGTQKNQTDTSGVFYQQYDQTGQAVGSETLVNLNTSGNQQMPSIGSDANGNCVVAWTGTTAQGTTDVFKANLSLAADSTGPIVTDVARPDTSGTLVRILDGDAVEPPSPGLTQLVVTFDENLDVVALGGDTTLYLHSVLNLANWTLQQNGSNIVGGIANVSFGLDEAYNRGLSSQPSHKYEAVLTLDGNGLNSGQPLLSAGNYTLVASDQVWDADYRHDPATGQYIGNALDGDFDGQPGTNSNYSGQQGYVINFAVVTTPQVGAENLVDGVDAAGKSDTSYDKTTSEVLGTGTAREQTTRSVAVDDSGDFAAVWTSYGQDDPSDPYGAGVYMRLYDRNNNPLTADVLVNTYTKGNQEKATVAMDADGDFVVVWESDGQDPDGSWGIYAQRFNSVGTKVGGEFRVNTNYTNDQTDPAVAMDSFGNFVVVWATAAQPFGYSNDIHGQMFDTDGNRVGNELLINTQNIPGSGEVNPSVAMNDSDDFVVTWDQVTQQSNGVVTDTDIVGRVFDRNGNPLPVQTSATGNGQNQTSTAEFRVDVGDGKAIGDPQTNPTGTPEGGTDTHRTARNSQVAMDSAGNFVVVWESFEDNDVGDATPESYGIYSRRFDINTPANAAAYWSPATTEDQKDNLTITAPDAATAQQVQYQNFAGNQVNPSVAMDASGDYVIAWDGNGATPNPLDPANPLTQSDAETQGVWIRSFHAEDPQNAGEFEAVTTQSRINVTSAGSQEFPSLAMTPNGQVIAVWSGNGVGDQHGIFFRRYNTTSASGTSVNTVGPMVTDFLLPNGSSIAASGQVTQPIQALVVTFDEAMFDNATHTGSAVTNPANYELMQNGVVIPGGISQVYYGLDEANVLGSQYGLNVPKLNKYEAVLIVDANGPSSGTPPLSDGQYQIVALNSLRDSAGNPLNGGRLSAINPNTNKFTLNPNGSVSSPVISFTLPTGQETLVSTDKSGGSQTDATTADAVAADANGDYVVAWTDNTPGHQGVWAKMYQQTSTLNADGSRTTSVNPYNAINPATGLPWTNDEILVSFDPTMFAISDASVARDVNGDFVVTWSAESATTNWDVYAEQFNAAGQAFNARRLPSEHLGERLRQQREELPERRPTLLLRVDGRRRRLRHHLAEQQPGRQRLRRLCPGLQRRGPGRGRRQRGAGHRLHQWVHRHVQAALGQRRQSGDAGHGLGPHHLHRQRRRRGDRHPERAGGHGRRGRGRGQQHQRGADRVRRRLGRRIPTALVDFAERRGENRRKEYRPDNGVGGHAGHRRVPRERHHGRQPRVPRRCHGRRRRLRHYLDQLRPGRRQRHPRQRLRQALWKHQHRLESRRQRFLQRGRSGAGRRRRGEGHLGRQSRQPRGPSGHRLRRRRRG